MKRISQLVERQLPPHFSDEGSLLPAFLKAYYEWTELDGNFQNQINTIQDLYTSNKAPQDYIDYLVEEFFGSLPTNISVSKAQLIQHSREFFSSRGTPASFEFLFNSVFREQVQIVYPKDNLFKPSAATWVLVKSVFIESPVGLNSEDIAVAYISQNNQRDYIDIRSIRQVSETVYEVQFVSQSVTSLTSESRLFLDDVSYSLKLTTETTQVLQAGTGFSVGEIYEIVVESGRGTKIKIEQVDSLGGIKKISFVEVGFGYDLNINYTLYPSSTQVVSTDTTFEISGDTSYSQQDYEGTNSIGDFGTIINQDYVVTNYLFDETYVGVILARFSDQTSRAIVTNENEEAVIAVKIGYLAKLAGYYENRKGFLSDYSILQDSFYHQDFSYVIRSKLQLGQYDSLLFGTIHPVGQKAFADFSIEQDYDADITLETSLS